MDERETKMFWQMVFAASIMAGKTVQGATTNADQGKAAYEARFKTERDDDED